MNELSEKELATVAGGASTGKKIPATYTVVAGDNLSTIAARFNTTWKKLYDLNKTLIDKTAFYIEEPENQEVLILQGDVPEEAERLKAQLTARIPDLTNVRIQDIGPVIGAHCGPGTIAVCFFGKEIDI